LAPEARFDGRFLVSINRHLDPVGRRAGFAHRRADVAEQFQAFFAKRLLANDTGMDDGLPRMFGAKADGRRCCRRCVSRGPGFAGEVAVGGAGATGGAASVVLRIDRRGAVTAGAAEAGAGGAPVAAGAGGEAMPASSWRTNWLTNSDASSPQLLQTK